MADAPVRIPVSTVRPCLACGLSDGMKLQNNGFFSAHYICVGCDTSLTVPPPKLLIPGATFET
jgi:hypothetical protein